MNQGGGSLIYLCVSGFVALFFLVLWLDIWSNVRATAKAAKSIEKMLAARLGSEPPK